MPHFEKFDRQRLPAQTEPQVTVQKRGSLSLNRSAFAALGSPDSVELLYDRAAATIGLRKTDARDAAGTHVRRSPKSRSGPWLVSAMAFVKFYGIDTAVTRRWSATMVEGVLCVDLTATPVAVRGGVGEEVSGG